MSAMTDAELLERLGECLLADPVPPGAAERQVLHRALDEAPAAPVVELHSERQWRRLRRPVAATIAATILLSGTAAAAVETNTLPGPLRSLAVTLGLPVTPGAFAQAQRALSDLTNALAAQDSVAVRADLVRLQAALAQLSPSDRAELGPGVAGLIAQADIFLVAQPSATSDEKSSGASRGGDRNGRENSTDDADGSSDRAGGGDQGESNDSDGSGSPTQAGPSAATATAPSGQSDGDDTSGGTVASGTPSPTGVDGDGSSGSSDGGSTTVGSTSPSGSDGSGPSGGSDGSGTSGGSDGGSGGTDGGGSPS
jgi:hypothetical protein